MCVNHLSVEKIKEEVIKKYSGSKRLTHILGVASLAKSLAKKYGLDETKAEIAGLLHDYCKYESIEEMKRIIGDQMIIDKFKDAPQIYHAYASRVMAEKKFGITDSEILLGIQNHVYGRIGMSLFEKILVISDFAEDSREYENCRKVRSILDSGDFNKAMYLCIKYTIDAVIANHNKPMEEQYIILKELEKLL